MGRFMKRLDLIEFQSQRDANVKIASMAEQLAVINVKRSDLATQKASAPQAPVPMPGPAPGTLPPAATPTAEAPSQALASMPGPAPGTVSHAAAPAPVGHRGPGFISLQQSTEKETL